jgi:hypothetical protein
MRLSAPKNITWLIALVLAVIGLLAQLNVIAALYGSRFWWAFAAAVLLLLATWLKGL